MTKNRSIVIKVVDGTKRRARPRKTFVSKSFARSEISQERLLKNAFVACLIIGLFALAGTTQPLTSIPVTGYAAGAPIAAGTPMDYSGLYLLVWLALPVIFVPLELKTRKLGVSKNG